MPPTSNSDTSATNNYTPISNYSLSETKENENYPMTGR